MPPQQANAANPLLEEEEEVVQAVILADSFNSRFKPLTSSRPRCLLPICNTTLLDWTFESLALAGVQEIFVICRSYAEQVKTAIKESAWSRDNSGVKIVPIITAKESFTPGDAMRDIYTHGIIKSDFVLVHGDLISNVRIDEVVRIHKERRRTDKDAIMTIVVKEAGAVHRTKSRADSSLFVLDAETSECLHYEGVAGFPPKQHAHIPREIIASHPELEIRHDLIDCNIDICSLEVPSLFQDNFDYGDIRRDFVHGILTSDLLEKKIHCHVLQDGYAARVQDTRLYDSISKDILARWTFPLVPGDHQLGGDVYEYRRGNKYIAKDSVTLARTCKIGNNCLIGSGTQIHDNANITSSVIGKNCTIGPGSVVRGCYLWDGTTIGANCTVEESIFGFGVEVREKSRVERGCLIADQVFVGPEAYVEPYTKLGRKKTEEEKTQADGEDDEDEELEEAIKAQDPVALGLGAQSNAFVWPKSSDEDLEDDDVENSQNQRLMQIGDDGLELNLMDAGSLTSSEDEDSDDDSDNDFLASPASSATSLPSIAPSGIQALTDEAAVQEFDSEVRASLERAFVEGHSVDNAAVELKTLRMASNVPLRRVRDAVVGSIVDRIEIVEGTAAQRDSIGKVVGRWGDLITKIGGADPVETIEVLQIHCATGDRLNLFGQILASFYQSDIVDEVDIRKWHAVPASKGISSGALEETMKRCWTVGSRMIEQFDAQEDDSDEDESDDDDEKPAPAIASVRKAEGSEDETDEEDEEDIEEAAVSSVAISTTASGKDVAVENNEEEEEDEPENDPPVPTRPEIIAQGIGEESSEEEDDDGSEEASSEEEVAATGTKAASTAAKPPTPAVNTLTPPATSIAKSPAEDSSEESEEDGSGEEESSEEEEHNPKPPSSSVNAAVSQKPAPAVDNKTPTEKVEESSDEEEEESEEESEEEETSEEETSAHAVAPKANTSAAVPTGALSPKAEASKGITNVETTGISPPAPGPSASQTAAKLSSPNSINKAESSSEEEEESDEDGSEESDEPSAEVPVK